MVFSLKSVLLALVFASSSPSFFGMEYPAPGDLPGFLAPGSDNGGMGMPIAIPALPESPRSPHGARDPGSDSSGMRTPISKLPESPRSTEDPGSDSREPVATSSDEDEEPVPAAHLPDPVYPVKGPRYDFGMGWATCAHCGKWIANRGDQDTGLRICEGCWSGLSNPLHPLNHLKQQCASKSVSKSVEQIELDVPRTRGGALHSWQTDGLTRILLAACANYPDLQGYTQGENFVAFSQLKLAEANVEQDSSTLDQYREHVVQAAWINYKKVLTQADYKNHLKAITQVIRVPGLTEKLETAVRGRRSRVVELFAQHDHEELWAKNYAPYFKYPVMEALKNWTNRAFLSLFLCSLDVTRPEMVELLQLIADSDNFVEVAVVMLMVLLDYDDLVLSVSGGKALKESIESAEGIGSFSYAGFVDNVKQALLSGALEKPFDLSWVSVDDDKNVEVQGQWFGLKTFARDLMA